MALMLTDATRLTPCAAQVTPPMSISQPTPRTLWSQDAQSPTGSRAAPGVASSQ